MIEPTTGEPTKLVSPTLAQPQVVQHYNVNGRYRIVIERAASTKGVLGYKIEANGDIMGDVIDDAKVLKELAERIAVEPEPKEAKP